MDLYFLVTYRIYSIKVREKIKNRRFTVGHTGSFCQVIDLEILKYLKQSSMVAIFSWNVLNQFYFVGMSLMTQIPTCFTYLRALWYKDGFKILSSRNLNMVFCFYLINEWFTICLRQYHILLLAVNYFKGVLWKITCRIVKEKLFSITCNPLV